jgi:rRNA maturation protein Nop10
MVSFEDYELAWWFLDGTCVNCGNIVTVPCPADKDEAQPYSD